MVQIYSGNLAVIAGEPVIGQINGKGIISEMNLMFYRKQRRSGKKFYDKAVFLLSGKQKK